MTDQSFETLKTWQKAHQLRLDIHMKEVRRLPNGYITWLKDKKIGANEPGAGLGIRETPPDYFIDIDLEK